MTKLSFFFLISALIGSVGMQAMQKTLEEDAAELVGAGVTLMRVVAPGGAHLYQHPGRYQEAAWVSVGAPILYKGFTRYFKQLTGASFAVPEFVDDKQHLKWLLNRGSRTSNWLLNNIAGPVAVAIAIQKGMERAGVPNRKSAPEAPSSEGRSITSS